MKRFPTACLLALVIGIVSIADAQWSYVREIKMPSADTSFVRPYLCTVDGNGRLYVISSKATDASAHNAIYYADPGDTEFTRLVDYQYNGDSDTSTGYIGALRGISSIGTDVIINASQPYPKTQPNTVSAAYYYPAGDTTRVEKFGFGLTGSGYGTYNHGFALTKDTIVVAGVTAFAAGPGPGLRFYNYGNTLLSPARGSWMGETPLEPGGTHFAGVDVIRDVAVLPDGDYSVSTTPIYSSRNSYSEAQQTGGIAQWTGGTVAGISSYTGQRVADAVGLLSFSNYVAFGIAVDASGNLWVARGDSSARWVKAFDMSAGVFASEVAELPGQNSEINPDPSGAPMLGPCDVALNADGTTAYVIDNLTRSAFVFTSGSVSVEAGPEQVSSFLLRQNYPNPFNPATSISFTLPASARVRLVVTNQLGQEVAVLADGVMAPGIHVRTFNAGNLPSGVYFYTMTAGALRETKSMLLLK